MNINELKDKAISSSKWSVIEKIALQVAQFIIGIFLARLLGPKAFGIIALTFIFISVSGAIMDGGFERTFIQNQNLTSLQINTVFYINILLGILMALLICLAAPSLSVFFKAPELTNILQVLSIGLPIDALGQTQRTLLMKELNFKKFSIAHILSVCIGGIVGILFALAGFGVWSLVYYSLTSTLVSTLVYWYKSSWYPKFLFSLPSIYKLVPFGLNVLASSILFALLQQFNVFIIGKYYSKTDLGLYTRGKKFPEMITSLVEGVVLKVSFPLFSKLQDDNERLLKVVRMSNRIIAFITFPLLVFLFINANEIIVFLLTEKWIGAAIFLKLFCLVNLFDPFIVIQRELLLAKGKAGLLLRLFLFTSFFEIIPILLVIKHGITYVVLVTLASKIIQYIVYLIAGSRNLKISFFETFRWISPHFLIALLSGTVVIILNSFLPESISNNLPLKLVIDVIVGGSIYFITAFAIKLEEINTFKLTFQSLLNRK